MADEALQILFVEDDEQDFFLMTRELSSAGLKFESRRVATGIDYRKALRAKTWDVVISDYTVPGFGGLEALSILHAAGIEVPFILVSGSVGEEKAAESIRLGAKDFLLKRNLGRLSIVVEREIRAARTEAEAQKSREHLDRLKRFFPRGVAERLSSGEQSNPFAWHRKDVTVLFVDLHGFTSFVELTEPEIVVQVLKEYYARVAKAVLEFGGTVGHVAGDGVMIFFNDPIDVAHPQEMAIRTGVRLKVELNTLQQKWSDMAYAIDFGAGVASGFATVGGIGVEGCWDYSIIGTVTNVAQRLCSIAKNGQILIPQRIVPLVSPIADLAPLGTQELKGLHEATAVYDVIGLKGLKATP